MTEDRRTKQGATPGQDPREIDRERTTDAAVEEVAAFERIVHTQDGSSGSMGTSSEGDLADPAEEPDAERPRTRRDDSAG